MERSASADIDEAKFPAALRNAIGFSRVVSLDSARRASVIEFDARREFSHSGGTTIQGGIIVAWIDHAMAWAVHAHDSTCSVASLEVKTTFLGRVGPGPVVVEARVLKIGRRVAFLEARVLSGAEVLVTASSSALVLNQQPRPGA